MRKVSAIGLLIGRCHFEDLIAFRSLVVGVIGVVGGRTLLC